MMTMELPKVEVFGKKNCPNCEDLKDFLREKNIPHIEHSMDYHGVYHDGWREDGSVDALAAYQFIVDLPMVKIGDDFFTAEEAQKVLTPGK